MTETSTPRDDGFAMPAEFAPHQATWMSWPTTRELWGEDRLDEARDEWAGVANAVAAFEPVVMVCQPGSASDVRKRCGAGVEPLEAPIDDSWLRDNGPIFVTNGDEVALVHFGFNSWGEKYLPYDQDARLPEVLASHFGVRRYVAPFVLEGGSFFVDGEGTLLTTEQCLLHPNRNPSMTKEQIENGLRAFLGVETIVWLPHGLVEDRDTDGHVDGLAQYVRPGAVMFAVASGEEDPNAPRFAEDRDVLADARDARGRSIEVIDGPVNTFVDLEGIGPVVIPYMNHYLANGAAIVPVGGVPGDEPALELLAKAYPDREVIGVPGAMISHGGGGPHCITQQVPEGSIVS